MWVGEIPAHLAQQAWAITCIWSRCPTSPQLPTHHHVHGLTGICKVGGKGLEHGGSVSLSCLLCLLPGPGIVRASSVFPILSTILLLLGGLCIGAGRFYSRKNNIVLSAGILFVAAGEPPALVPTAQSAHPAGEANRTATVHNELQKPGCAGAGARRGSNNCLPGTGSPLG